MKTIVNTACADYFAGGTNRRTTSNKCKLYTLIRHCFVQGEAVCTRNCRRWQVDIVQKNNGKTAFSIGGYTSKKFCFEPDTDFEYKLIFTADRYSTLRLYNTPENVTDIIYCENG